MAAYYKTETVDFTTNTKKSKEFIEFGADHKNESNINKAHNYHSDDLGNNSSDFLSSDDDDSDEEEYFEDDIVTGKLRIGLSSENLDDISTDEEEIGSEELTVAASQQFAKDYHAQKNERNGYNSFISGLSNKKSSSFMHIERAPAPNLYLSLDATQQTQLPTEGFLFEEKASTEIPDSILLKKVQACFDQEKIKDNYVLSGRLQDILTPVEIEEILTHSELYSGYIEDQIFEMLTITQKNKAKHKNFPINGKKKIGAEEIRKDLKNDLEIRAMFESQKKHNYPFDAKLSPVKQTATELTAHSNGNIRAFFEESVVKSSSTLKRICPDVNLDLSTSTNCSTLSQSKTYSRNNSLILNVNDLSRSTLNGSYLSDTDRPSNLVNGFNKKKIAVSSEMHNPLDDDDKSLSSLSNKSDLFSPVEDMVTPDDIDTPDLEDSNAERGIRIPELSAVEELDEERSWKVCQVGNIQRRIDIKVIEPYKKVISHGGYFGESRQAIIVFSACYLPDRSRLDYDYVMDNLFLYVISSLEDLVAEDYVLIYLHGATDRGNMPSFGWLKRCYQMIDRRLRKNLKGLYLVHPTFWLKTIVLMTRPFVSSKFSRKLKFVSSLKALSELIPMDHICIPDKVKSFDIVGSMDS